MKKVQIPDTLYRASSDEGIRYGFLTEFEPGKFRYEKSPVFCRELLCLAFLNKALFKKRTKLFLSLGITSNEKNVDLMEILNKSLNALEKELNIKGRSKIFETDFTNDFVLAPAKVWFRNTVNLSMLTYYIRAFVRLAKAGLKVEKYTPEDILSRAPNTLNYSVKTFKDVLEKSRAITIMNCNHYKMKTEFPAGMYTEMTLLGIGAFLKGSFKTRYKSERKRYKELKYGKSPKKVKKGV